MRECDAPERFREQFVFSLSEYRRTHGADFAEFPLEFRFGGKLGWGGKYKETVDGHPYVTFYEETDIDGSMRKLKERVDAILQQEG